MRSLLLCCAALSWAWAGMAQELATLYYPYGQIHSGNVHQLKQAWIYRTGEPLTPNPGGGRAPAFEATPLHAAGLLYISTPYGKVVALEPETGRSRWTFDSRIDPRGNFGDFANRGVAYWRDGSHLDEKSKREAAVCLERIFFAPVDARLIALDAKTGRRCKDFGKGGEIDLTLGLRRGPAYPGEYEQTSPPAVIGDVVVAGSAIADNNRVDAPSGEVRAFDARSGKLRWTWDPLAANPEAGGANVWSVIRTDSTRNLVFLPTGSASPDYFGGHRPGDNLYANSMVVLDARTGRIVWHFQTVHHDLWDYDVASPAALYSVEARSGRTAAVAVGSKTGHLFLLNRETGKPLFPVEERPAPKSDIPEEQPSPTQPFPMLPPPLVSQKLSPEDAWGPTPADRTWCQEQLKVLRNEGIFTPPSRNGSLIVPGNIGGLHWGGIAFDAMHGLLIAPVNQMPAVVRLIPRDQVEQHRRTHPQWETSLQKGAPYAMSRTFLRSPSGLPCSAPPFGMLVAVDARSGQIRWKAPLGRLPMPGKGGGAAAKASGRLAGSATGNGGLAPAEWGSINLGGPIVTKGGLIFIGAALDPVLRAFDSETGKELWQGPLPASARSVPTSYLGSDGKQYVVIAAGGHDRAFGPLDNAVVAFALPE